MVCKLLCVGVQAAMWWVGGPCDYSISPEPWTIPNHSDYIYLEAFFQDINVSYYLQTLFNWIKDLVIWVFNLSSYIVLTFLFLLMSFSLMDWVPGVAVQETFCRSSWRDWRERRMCDTSRDPAQVNGRAFLRQFWPVPPPLPPSCRHRYPGIRYLLTSESS